MQFHIIIMLLTLHADIHVNKTKNQIRCVHSDIFDVLNFVDNVDTQSKTLLLLLKHITVMINSHYMYYISSND